MANFDVHKTTISLGFDRYHGQQTIAVENCTSFFEYDIYLQLVVFALYGP